MPQDHSTIWNSCLRTIRDSVDPQSYRTWFEPIKPVKLMSNELTIQVPHRLFYEWLEEHYVDVLKNSIHKAMGRNGKLLYQVLNRGNKKAQLKAENGHRAPATKSVNADDTDPKQVRNPFVIPGIRRPHVESNLNPRFKFENFIEGDCNSLARNAAKAVADKPANTAFNPLVIHGPVGLGKTHLLQAIGNHVVERFPRKSVLYVTTDQFTNQIIDSIQRNATADLLNFYQHIDVLLVDDIQQLYNRTKTQDIFFNLFNILRQNNKAIILTCDRPIKDLNIEDRLKSRFQWGLTADLSIPALETRMAILNAKAQSEELSIPGEVAEFICHHVKENIRQLEGVLNNLVLRKGVEGRDIDINLAREVTEKFVDRINKEVTPDNIKKAVADHYGLDVEKLQSTTRVRQVVLARQVSMFLVKEYTESSLKAIGNLFGGKDHSTVLYSIRTIKNLMETDDELKATLEELERRIKLGQA